MNKKYYCTYFDKNYLIKGLSLLSSLQKHEKDEYDIFVVCLDELTRLILTKLNMSNIKAIPIHEIEFNDFVLLEAKRNRSLIEYYWTLTPSIILKLLRANEGIDLLTYLDSDLYFYSSPDPILKEIENKSILIHEHRFPKKFKHLENYGIYNVGLLSFRNDKIGNQVLNWWRDKCIEWCYSYLDKDRFGDQKYLDKWPKQYKGVAVLKNIAAGVAPWNHEQYFFTEDKNKTVFVNNNALIFYHFHSFTFINEAVVVPISKLEYKISLNIAKYCFIPYVKELHKSIQKVRAIIPGYQFGLNNPDKLDQGHIFIAWKTIRQAIEKLGLSNSLVELDENWDLYFNEIQGIKQESDSVVEKRIVLHKSPNKNTQIKVSAIVSAYNSEIFIRGCLYDLINQTLFEKGVLEIVVVNSGSNQNEEEIVKDFQNRFDNIKYIKTERETVYQAWNRGIKLASGKYITNANTDDRHRKDALEVMADVLESSTNIGLVYADQYVTKKGNQAFEKHDVAGYFEWPEFDRIQLIHCSACGPQPMWRKSLHEKYGYFNESLKVAGDYEWWLRISDKVQLKHIPEKLGLYMLSDASIEHHYTGAMRNETLKIRLDYAQQTQLKTLDYSKYKATFLTLKNQDHPLVSVIIPTYNRLGKLKNAVESVLSQTYENYEIIIVNDAGEDVTRVINEFNNGKLKLLNSSMNKGLAAARNIGIKAAKGEYIAFLDDDDIFYKNHLQVAINNLDSLNKVIYTDAVRKTYLKDGEKYILQSETVPYSIDYDRNKVLIGNIAPVNCFVFEKSLIEKAGTFDESLPVLEDWEFWLRLSTIANFKHIKENTVEVNWYNDGSTLTSSKAEEFGKTRNLIYNKYENEINKIQNLNDIVNKFNSIWQNDNKGNLPLVSIIALTFNQLDYTKAFIDSVFKNTDVFFELIIVDNNSKYNTVKYLKKLSEANKNVKVIFNKENLGFPKGVNQAIKISSGSYIIVANNDIIVTKDWLRPMIELAEKDSKIGLVGPISNFVSGVQLDKNAVYKTIEEMHVYAATVCENNRGKFFQFPRVAFLCTLIKRAVINKIGGLDERFSPGNFEDDDFCLRAQTAGYKTVIAQGVFIHHFGSKSFTAEGFDKYQERLDINKKIFVDKWGADPEEIWLHGKPIKTRNIEFPLDADETAELVKRSQICIQDQEYQRALGYLELVINNDRLTSKIPTQNLDPLFNLAGKICFMLKLFERAIKYYKKVLQFNPQALRAYSGLGEVYSEIGNEVEAIKMFEKAGERKVYDTVSMIK
jgi:GT2 family glycosyltransferase